MTALLLAWAASRARSLLAARCLVAAALELYARGATADDVQLCLSLAGAQRSGTRCGAVILASSMSHHLLLRCLGTTGACGSPIAAKQQVQVVVAACAGLQSGGVWLGEDERDVLTSWAALVFMAAEEVGCPAGSRLQQQAGADGSDSSSQSIASPAAGGPRGGAAGDGSSTSLGMRRFVKQAVAQFAGGTRLADLIELQVACCFTQLA